MACETYNTVLGNSAYPEKRLVFSDRLFNTVGFKPNSFCIDSGTGPDVGRILVTGRQLK